jgi:hypothetical protein
MTSEARSLGLGMSQEQSTFPLRIMDEAEARGAPFPAIFLSNENNQENL